MPRDTGLVKASKRDLAWAPGRARKTLTDVGPVAELDEDGKHNHAALPQGQRLSDGARDYGKELEEPRLVWCRLLVGGNMVDRILIELPSGRVIEDAEG